jgi:predicted  nucleic acid-binding Zn-ribbon protein
MNEPKQEYRIRFLEKQYLNLGGHFEQLEDEIRQGHIDIGKAIDSHANTLTQQLTAIESTMATKDDLTAMEGQIKEDTGAIEIRLDRMESDIASTKDDISELKDMMKQLLQQKSGE